ncbi:dTDP-4-amino-4,6-dideoxygalactose transaminase [Selenomonas ruminantium]|uniref:dTDP-4-amino-4,6-dideoxygalactose transaminase n=1 Tax=Selenomonas ruminantium TaxID=971 RepID=A0A1I3EH15_SELRU|nr:hypothetical protein [Selenomonas ruminantium]SFH98256.1 dTDP-4-amino-4,6-dideoxygalactose transaminase [Selenomonas ruminantium]
MREDMQELGGYIEFERFDRPMKYADGILLNSGRSCLEYLLRAKNISLIYLPWFCCSSVRDTCLKIGTEVRQYDLGEDWLPCNLEAAEDAYVYIVNFYGQVSAEQILMLKEKYKHIIVDNAQAYFAAPVTGVDTLYTCRKFFGVADGGVLYTDVTLDMDLPLDESFTRMHFLLGRYERTASEFYQEYIDNNKIFASEGIKRMSTLTQNLLHGVDYEKVSEKRTRNFELLNREFAGINKLHIKSTLGGYCYPLLLDEGASIRRRMIKEKIYVPCLWPNVLEDVQAGTWEYELATNVLPLPIDQRYGRTEMEYIVKKIREIL